MHSRDLIEQYKSYVQDWRRYFHKHPELSNEEFETTKTLAKELEAMGVEVQVDTDRGTGLIGVIRGDKTGKAIALRADIDALPVQEHNTFDFKSDVDGKMHACGHDGHMAILLGAAKMLMSMKDRIEGTVYLAFQPAEETGAGAPGFIKFGDWYEKIDAIFGGHVWIDLPAGFISVEEGPRMAASSIFNIKVTGKQGHGAQPHQAVDAVVVASAIVLNLQTVVSRNVSALDSVVVTIGNIHSGT
ncbi:M20 metallopeptidase family protein, partial [Veillonella caviae]